MKSGSQNKKKAHQSAKKKGYYQVQGLRTGRNKLRRAKKRKGRVDFWLGKGTKKNGQPVKGAQYVSTN